MTRPGGVVASLSNGRTGCVVFQAPNAGGSGGTQQMQYVVVNQAGSGSNVDWTSMTTSRRWRSGRVWINP